MTNFYYLNEERINSLFEQMMDLSLTGGSITTDTATSREMGGSLSIPSIFTGEMKHTRSKSDEKQIDFTLATEQKLAYLIKNKADYLRRIIDRKEMAQVGKLVVFDNLFHCSGLKTPDFYNSSTWDGSTPELETRINNVVIKIDFSPAHFTSPTVWSIFRAETIRLGGAGIIIVQAQDYLQLSSLGFGGITK